MRHGKVMESKTMEKFWSRNPLEIFSTARTTVLSLAATDVKEKLVKISKKVMPFIPVGHLTKLESAKEFLQLETVGTRTLFNDKGNIVTAA